MRHPMNTKHYKMFGYALLLTTTSFATYKYAAMTPAKYETTVLASSDPANIGTDALAAYVVTPPSNEDGPAYLFMQNTKENSVKVIKESRAEAEKQKSAKKVITEALADCDCEIVDVKKFDLKKRNADQLAAIAKKALEDKDGNIADDQEKPKTLEDFAAVCDDKPKNEHASCEADQLIALSNYLKDDEDQAKNVQKFFDKYVDRNNVLENALKPDGSSITNYVTKRLSGSNDLDIDDVDSDPTVADNYKTTISKKAEGAKAIIAKLLIYLKPTNGAIVKKNLVKMDATYLEDINTMYGKLMQKSNQIQVIAPKESILLAQIAKKGLKETVPLVASDLKDDMDDIATKTETVHHLKGVDRDNVDDMAANFDNKINQFLLKAALIDYTNKMAALPSINNNGAPGQNNNLGIIDPFSDATDLANSNANNGSLSPQQIQALRSQDNRGILANGQNGNGLQNYQNGSNPQVIPALRGNPQQQQGYVGQQYNQQPQYAQQPQYQQPYTQPNIGGGYATTPYSNGISGYNSNVPQVIPALTYQPQYTQGGYSQYPNYQVSGGAVLSPLQQQGYQNGIPYRGISPYPTTGISAYPGVQGSYNPIYPGQYAATQYPGYTGVTGNPYLTARSAAR